MENKLSYTILLKNYLDSSEFLETNYNGPSYHGHD